MDKIESRLFNLESRHSILEQRESELHKEAEETLADMARLFREKYGTGTVRFNAYDGDCPCDIRYTDHYGTTNGILREATFGEDGRMESFVVTTEEEDITDMSGLGYNPIELCQYVLSQLKYGQYTEE